MTKTKKYSFWIIGSGLLITWLFALPTPSQGSNAEIALTWSTDTYIPSNYPGKALPVRGSMIEVVANSDQNSQNLTYRWILNKIVQETNSQILRFKIGENSPRDYLIKVEARDKNGNFLGVSPYLTISIQKPKIILKGESYQISANQEAEFTAQPYFFNINNPSQLDYLWKLGNEEAILVDNQMPNIFILKLSQLIEPMTKILSVSAMNKDNSSQKAQTEVELNLTP